MHQKPKMCSYPPYLPVYQLNQIKKHANIDFAAIMNPDRFDFLIAQTFENLVVSLSLSERVDMVSKCENTSKMTFDIMSNKTSINILETLQKCKVVGLMSQMLFKEANSIYASQAWNPHQDNIYAHMWANLAAVSGDGMALILGRDLRDGVAKLMASDQIAKAQKLARECVRKNYKRC